MVRSVSLTRAREAKRLKWLRKKANQEKRLRAAFAARSNRSNAANTNTTTSTSQEQPSDLPVANVDIPPENTHGGSAAASASCPSEITHLAPYMRANSISQKLVETGSFGELLFVKQEGSETALPIKPEDHSYVFV